VMGSHGFPGWFWTALDKIKADEYGATDVRETFDDATQLAIRDQERAGIDVICDGEMRRFFFVQSFYGKMDGLETLEPLRKTGLYAYDSVPRYRAARKVTVPRGLGPCDGFKFLWTQTNRPVKATCPGPVTLSIHIQTRPGDAYDGDRLPPCRDPVPAGNAAPRQPAPGGGRRPRRGRARPLLGPGARGERGAPSAGCGGRDLDPGRRALGRHRARPGRRVREDVQRLRGGRVREDRLPRVLWEPALAAARQAVVSVDVPGAAGNALGPVRLRVREPRDGGDRDVEGDRGRPRRRVRRD